MAAFEAICLNMRCQKPNTLSTRLRIATQNFHTGSRRFSPNSKPHDEPLPDEAPFEVDLATKTVNTVVGSLPLSPMMDPSFYKARQRFIDPKDKESSTVQKTKFRRLLERNPYALALATPPRKCSATKTILPTYFLHRFQLVAHPTTAEPWFIPQGLEPRQKKPPPPPPAPEDASSNTEPVDDPAPATTPPSPPTKPRKPTTGQSDYLLARHDLHRELQNPSSPLRGAQRALLRQGTAFIRGAEAAINRAVWRDDMDAFLLTAMRRRAVEDLLFYADLVEQQGRKYLVRCAGWDEIRELKHRGCVLVLGGAEVPRLSTMSIEGARFGEKLVVHDLRGLLGEDGVEQLRGSSGLFKEGDLFLLGRRRTVELQMQLWKLQGFLAFEREPTVSEEQ
ncbi:hypothetical protein QBC39DRAFT_339962 [Podospora conica]|nr:hypothetical protein QBC39DRAFT_339962 [Schizothecium conicum]